MSESLITLKLSANDTQKSIQLIQGFQKLRKSKDDDEQVLKEITNEFFGESFTNTIFSELKSEKDVLKYKKYIDKKYLDDLDHFVFSLRNRTLNDQRIWQDTYSKTISGYELSPSDITLKTRSVTGETYWDDIELNYDSDDCYILNSCCICSSI